MLASQSLLAYLEGRCYITDLALNLNRLHLNPLRRVLLQSFVDHTLCLIKSAKLSE